MLICLLRSQLLNLLSQLRILRLLSRQVLLQLRIREAAAAAAAVAPRVAWPRSGRWSLETTRRAFDPSTVLDPSSPSDRAAREARAVARCVARLIRRRVEQDARRGGGAAAERDDV